MSSFSMEAPPNDFICPLTHEIMSEPVTTPEGINYEKAAIEGWLRDASYCPEHGSPLSVASLTPNVALQWKIRYWQLKNAKDVSAEQEHKQQAASTTSAAAPHKFYCPITKEIMKDPVMTQTGYTFERSALRQWMEVRGESCPISSKPLPLSHITSHRTLKQEIQFWKKQQQKDQEETTVKSSSHEEKAVKVQEVLVVAMNNIGMCSNKSSMVKSTTKGKIHDSAPNGVFKAMNMPATKRHILPPSA